MSETELLLTLLIYNYIDHRDQSMVHIPLTTSKEFSSIVFFCAVTEPKVQFKAMWVFFKQSCL